jgi:phthiocerol/phenolphthiocerol synthesis type-I polyketide synthase E
LTQHQQALDALKQNWCQLLDVPVVNDGDNFFDLGGDSLLAIRLVEQLEDSINVPFPVEEFFLDGTFGGLRTSYERVLG